MPIPKRRPGEKREDFIPRCIRTVSRESDRPHAQIIAMCEQAAEKHLQRHVTLHGHLVQKALGNALLIQGTLLRPGTFTGLDGVPTHYDEAFIKRISETLQGTPIKFAHKISPTSMVPSIEKGETIGFWTASRAERGLKVRGYVFDSRAVHYVKQHPNIGLSMEAEVFTKANADGLEYAVDGTLTGGVLIEDPACPTCRIESAREVNLQSEEKGKPIVSATGTVEKFIDLVRDENLAKPSRDAFFTWLEDQLKKSGVAENIIGKVVTILKQSIKTPYPYPSPKAQEFLEAEYGKELAILLSEYSTCVGAEMKKGKSMAEAAKVCKGQTEGSVNMEQITTQLADARTELDQIKAERAAQLNAEVLSLTGEIQALEKDFDPTKFLEGISCQHVQKKMLQRYLDVLKKNVKPIKLQVDQQKAQDQAKNIAEEMFGKGATVESILEIPGK